MTRVKAFPLSRRNEPIHPLLGKLNDELAFGGILSPDEPNFFLDWVVSEGGVTPGWPLSALTIFAKRSLDVTSFRDLGMPIDGFLPC